MKSVFTILIMLGLVTIRSSVQAQPVIEFGEGVIRVVGLPGENFARPDMSVEQWTTVLSVYTQEAYVKKVSQPIGGDYVWDGRALIFQPAFPFSSGHTYHAVFSGEAFCKHFGTRTESIPQALELSFSVPQRDSEPPTIKAVYPLSDQVPENMLRMYIYFSAPMMPGEAFRHIRLFRENGEPVDKAFLVVDQELWDPDRRRFTLLFDPGRIKRDLRSNIDLGNPRCARGEKYRLEIDAAWRDVNGNPLATGFKKEFTVQRAIRVKVSPEHWAVTSPVTGSSAGMLISFDRPMDHVLALKYICIHGSSGQIPGQVEMPNDKSWKFIPDDPWSEGEYVIRISPLLEDTAGNNLVNVFDVDLSKESRAHSLEPSELRIIIQSQPDSLNQKLGTRN